MAQSTFVNSRGVVHKSSAGMSAVFPDVCLTPTPGGPVPIPYPNVAKAADTSGGPKRVTTDGSMPMVKDANYAKSTGDEAGSNGGVASGVIQSTAEFISYSFDVKFEGRNVCRLGDTMFHNKKNTMG